MDYADGGDLYTKIANQKKIGKGKGFKDLNFVISHVHRGPDPRLVRPDGSSHQAYSRSQDLASRFEDAKYIHDADKSD